jgi:3-oxoacyl-[acyl-carrier protein] reductase
MDLGITGKKALICGASKGLGRACAEALLCEGVHVTLVARGQTVLDDTLAAMQALSVASGGSVQGVACDITTPEGRAQALAVCPAPDILVNNAGGPPPGNFRDFGLEDWRRAVENNMLTPIALIQATIDGMMARGFGRIVNITSSTVKAPIRSLDLSSGARSGLTGFIASVAREAVTRNVTVNNLLPGAFATDRLTSTLAQSAQAQGQTAESKMAEWVNKIPAGRFGDPAEFGALCAFVCSAQAGYLTGQNILIDGGAYPGVF